MQAVTTVRLVDGTSVLVEVDRTAPAGRRRAGIARAEGIDLEAAMQKLSTLTKQLADTVISLHPLPDQFEIQFGIKLSAQAGIILAKAGTEANFAIKLTWNRSK